jgi:hypothetical protein
MVAAGVAMIILDLTKVHVIHTITNSCVLYCGVVPAQFKEEIVGVYEQSVNRA